MTNSWHWFFLHHVINTCHWFFLHHATNTCHWFFLHHVTKRSFGLDWEEAQFGLKTGKYALREKCPYSKLFWSVFSRIRIEYGPEYLRMRTLFTQWQTIKIFVFRHFHAVTCYYFYLQHLQLFKIRDLIAVNYSRKTLHRRCLAGFWIRLWKLCKFLDIVSNN